MIDDGRTLNTEQRKLRLRQGDHFFRIRNDIIARPVARRALSFMLCRLQIAEAVALFALGLLLAM